jgi:hypothetical protein
MNVAIDSGYMAVLGDQGAFEDGGLSGSELTDDPEAAALVAALQGQIAEQLGLDPSAITITVRCSQLRLRGSCGSVGRAPGGRTSRLGRCDEAVVIGWLRFGLAAAWCLLAGVEHWWTAPDGGGRVLACGYNLHGAGADAQRGCGGSELV